MIESTIILSRSIFSKKVAVFPANFYSFREIFTLSREFLLFPRNFYSFREIFTLSAKFLLFPRIFYSFREIFTLSAKFLLFSQNFYSFRKSVPKKLANCQKILAGLIFNYSDSVLFSLFSFFSLLFSSSINVESGTFRNMKIKLLQIVMHFYACLVVFSKV